MACGQIIVHDIEYLSIDTALQTCQGDSIHAIVDVSKRNEIGTTEVQKDAKAANSNASCNGQVAWTIDNSGPDSDVRYSKPLAIVDQDLLLIHLGETIGISPQLGMCLHGASFIQQTPPFLPGIRIDSKGAYVDKAL